MRILFVTHSFPRQQDDIAGAFVHRLACALNEAGDELLVLAPSAEGLNARATVDGVSTLRYRYAPRTWETLAYGGDMAEQVSASLRGKLALGGLLAGGAMAVRRAVRTFAPDVVHAHWWFPGALQAAWMIGRAPMVTTLHGSDVRLAANAPRSHGLFRRVMARAARVTAVSSWLADQAREMAPSLRAQILPMPADTTLFVPGSDRHASRLLFVGRLNAQKGVARLLDALASSTSGAALDIVGDGTDRAALERHAIAAGVADRVTWHGALPQRTLVPFYQRATALVIPSELEGLGLVGVEAQLCETPVIAFCSGGLTDIVRDGVSGLLVPPGDPSALVAAIDRIIADPARAASLGRAGRAQALATFSPVAAASAYQKVYTEAIADGR